MTLSWVVNRPGSGIDHPHASGDEFRNVWSHTYTSTLYLRCRFPVGDLYLSLYSLKAHDLNIHRSVFIGPCIIVIVEELKNQLDATYYFIVLLIGSTCFGHYYAHHQELTTMMFVEQCIIVITEEQKTN